MPQHSDVRALLHSARRSSLTSLDPTSSESVGYGRELEVACVGLKEMHRRGIKIAPGGDCGCAQPNPADPLSLCLTGAVSNFAWTPHGTYRDLELFAKYLGFTPMEAILSATAFGGEVMLQPEELGKVQPGYYADLVLVDGNPLEDITLLSGHKHIDMVMIVSDSVEGRS